MIDTKAVRVIVLDDARRVEAMQVLSTFRTDFYRCLTARADALFDVTDALLCTDGPSVSNCPPPKGLDGGLQVVATTRSRRSRTDLPRRCGRRPLALGRRSLWSRLASLDRGRPPR